MQTMRRIHEFNADPADIGVKFKIVSGTYVLGNPVAYARREASAEDLQAGLEMSGKRGFYRTSETSLEIQLIKPLPQVA